MRIFDCLKDIIEIKSGTLDQDPEFKKIWNSFMIARYLSMEPKYINIASEINELNKQGSLSSKQMYKYLLTKIPKGRTPYWKYIKKK